MTTEQTWLPKPTEPGLWWPMGPNGDVFPKPPYFTEAMLDCWSGWDGYRFARCDAKPPDPPAPEPVLPDVEVFDARIGGVGHAARFIRSDKSEWCYLVRGDRVVNPIKFNELTVIRPLHADAEELRELLKLKNREISALETISEELRDQLEQAEAALNAAGIVTADKAGTLVSVAEGIDELKGKLAAAKERADKAELAFSNACRENGLLTLEKTRWKADAEELRERLTLLEDTLIILRKIAKGGVGCGHLYGEAVVGSDAKQIEAALIEREELRNTKEKSDNIVQGIIDGADYRESHMRDNADPDELRAIIFGLARQLAALRKQPADQELMQDVERELVEARKCAVIEDGWDDFDIGELDLVIARVRAASDPVKPPMTTEPANEYSTKHPHEPDIPPTLDAEGRCRVCAMITERNAERDELRSALIRCCRALGVDPGPTPTPFILAAECESKAADLRDVPVPTGITRQQLQLAIDDVLADEFASTRRAIVKSILEKLNTAPTEREPVVTAEIDERTAKRIAQRIAQQM